MRPLNLAANPEASFDRGVDEVEKRWPNKGYELLAIVATPREKYLGKIYGSPGTLTGARGRAGTSRRTRGETPCAYARTPGFGACRRRSRSGPLNSASHMIEHHCALGHELDGLVDHERREDIVKIYEKALANGTRARLERSGIAVVRDLPNGGRS